VFDIYKSFNIQYEELESFKLPSLEDPYILRVLVSDVPYDFLIKINNSEKAIILGSGAYDSTKLVPPIFQRHKWIKHFKDNVIFYNDPTLYLGKINIGWGQGTPKEFYLEKIADILKLLLEKLNISQNKTLLYGSSAGGFMSLMLGGYLMESNVLVNNPQTIVWNYYENHINAMFNVAYPGISRDDIKKQYNERLNILDFYKKIKYVPNITYLQNIASKRDLTHHLFPFIEGLEEFEDGYFKNNIELILYSDKELGHSPLKLEDSLKYIYRELNKI
jgi:hypothetical protein